jgi:hypothetical protein
MLHPRSRSPLHKPEDDLPDHYEDPPGRPNETDDEATIRVEARGVQLRQLSLNVNDIWPICSSTSHSTSTIESEESRLTILTTNSSMASPAIPAQQIKGGAEAPNTLCNVRLKVDRRAHSQLSIPSALQTISSTLKTSFRTLSISGSGRGRGTTQARRRRPDRR